MDLIDYCNFGPRKVHILFALARSKENPNVSANDQPTLRKVVSSEEEVKQAIDELEHETRRTDHTYRLYATVNPRDTVSTANRLRNKINRWFANELGVGSGGGGEERTKEISSEWKSMLHQPESKAESRFLYDLDGLDEDDALDFRNDLQGYTNVLAFQETPNGYHIVVSPFNFNGFDYQPHDIELKRDGNIFVGYLNE